MRSVLFILAILSGSTSDEADGALEQRVRALSQQLRCLVCQNETIADSQADLASDLRQQIREQMQAGRSNAEIITFLTDRYGDFILYRPPLKPRTLALWLGPFVLLAAFVYVLFRFLNRWQALRIRSLSVGERRRAMELLRLGNDPNLDVYRDQIVELESDFRNGTLAREQFERDREDLERRLLEDCVEPQ
jgi:cytochrome c-type biogenesis protein CcmH